MVKLVLSRLTMLQSCKSQALADLKDLDKAVRQRLEWTDTKIL